MSSSQQQQEDGALSLGERTWNARRDFYDTLGNNPDGFTVKPFTQGFSMTMGQCFFWPNYQPGWIELELSLEKELSTGTSNSVNEVNPDIDKNQTGILCVTHGLTDQWGDHSNVDFGETGFPSPNLGFGFEIVFGTMDKENLPSIAMRAAVMHVSNTMSADPHGRLQLFKELADDERELVNSHPEFGFARTDSDGSEATAQMPPIGSFSMDIDGSEFPEHLRRKSTGRVGVLIGSTITHGLPSYISLPEGKAYLLEMTLLHPEELAHIQVCYLPARLEISNRLRSLPQKWLSSSSRPSVVPVPPSEIPCESVEEAIQMVKSWPPML